MIVFHELQNLVKLRRLKCAAVPMTGMYWYKINFKAFDKNHLDFFIIIATISNASTIITYKPLT